MTRRHTIELSEFERVVTVWAEYADGPGWSNTPLWALIQNGADGQYRVECLQPNEQPADAQYLYPVAAKIHQMMMAAVNSIVKIAG